MKNIRIEQLSNIELPVKKSTTKTFKKITLQDFWNINKKSDGKGWGTQVNNPCENYITDDGKIIEVYGIELFGVPTSIFKEV